ncbi:hypothetical protein [Massilia cavernae]|uniref:hypothetical protein n=1 Tax=Massilia cavernae TaxID=2320864 RepID=UPI001602FD53|nr:hypothetical protein [Massilia cavernae]
MHELVWGANFRYSWDRVTNSDIIAFLPAHTSQQWASLFAQDETSLRDDLRLGVGAPAPSPARRAAGGVRSGQGV